MAKPPYTGGEMGGLYLICWRRNYPQDRGTRPNKYFKEFSDLTVSIYKVLIYFDTNPDTVFGLFGRYCEESGLELKQAA